MDQIKIDRSFVGQLPSLHDQSLIRMVTDLARHIGVPTIAEGVETDEQEGILRDVGCDHLQGFLFATPLPPDQIDSWLRGGSGAPTPTSE